MNDEMRAERERARWSFVIRPYSFLTHYLITHYSFALHPRRMPHHRAIRGSAARGPLRAVRASLVAGVEAQAGHRKKDVAAASIDGDPLAFARASVVAEGARSRRAATRIWWTPSRSVPSTTIGKRRRMSCRRCSMVSAARCAAVGAGSAGRRGAASTLGLARVLIWNRGSFGSTRELPHGCCRPRTAPTSAAGFVA